MDSGNASMATNPPVTADKRETLPSAEELRSLIEYYFTTRNIRKDNGVRIWLAEKGENSPVNVGRFKARLKRSHGWALSTRQIMDALKDSKTLALVSSKHVQRRKPFNADDPDEPDDGRWSEADKRVPTYKPVAVHPGLKAGTFQSQPATGFEDGFIDAPMTPKEYEEECELYSTNEEIPTRIGSAIERFIARRKFTTQYHVAFKEFLAFGGIYPANRIGQGGSKKSIENDESLTKEDKLELCAQYDVDEDDKSDSEKWVLDFEGVVKAYLSTVFAEDLDEDTDDATIVRQCQVLMSFYGYLLYHNVVPEHATDIKAAKDIVAKARVELLTIQRLTRKLPSPFAKSCSITFGGEWQSIYGYDLAWDAEDTPESIAEKKVIAKATAKSIIQMAIQTLGSDALCDAALSDNLAGLKYHSTRTVTLEVTKIQRATEEAQEIFQSCFGGKDIEAGPIGTITCKYWPLHNPAEWDIPAHLKNKPYDNKTTYTFWLEDDFLAELYIGIKITASISFLGTSPTEGIWVLDSVSRLYCSFFLELPNEMTMKKPKQVQWNEETAMMTCDHPEAEKARAVLAEMKNELHKMDKAEVREANKKVGEALVKEGLVEEAEEML